MPQFRDMIVWRQAEILMQPVFIRLIDNIRKQLEESVWVGKYENIEVWPEGTNDETKLRVQQLRSELETLAQDQPEQAEEIQEALAQLPFPYPGYQLCLQHQEQQVTLELWSLCYQVCFQNYDAASGTSQTAIPSGNGGVAVDTSLFDETGDVDWNRLDDKVRQLVEQIFADLPTEQAGTKHL